MRGEAAVREEAHGGGAGAALGVCEGGPDGGGHDRRSLCSPVCDCTKASVNWDSFSSSSAFARLYSSS